MKLNLTSFNLKSIQAGKVRPENWSLISGLRIKQNKNENKSRIFNNGHLFMLRLNNKTQQMGVTFWNLIRLLIIVNVTMNVHLMRSLWKKSTYCSYQKWL